MRAARAALIVIAEVSGLVARKIQRPDSLRVRCRVEHPWALARRAETGWSTVRRFELEVHDLEPGHPGRDVPVALVVAVVPQDAEVRPDVELAGPVVADDVADREVAARIRRRERARAALDIEIRELTRTGRDPALEHAEDVPGRRRRRRV